MENIIIKGKLKNADHNLINSADSPVLLHCKVEPQDNESSELDTRDFCETSEIVDDQPIEIKRSGLLTVEVVKIEIPDFLFIVDQTEVNCKVEVDKFDEPCEISEREGKQPTKAESCQSNSSCVYLYQCPKCSKSFVNYSLLKAHIAMTHNDSKVYTCSKFGKSFKHATTLKTHLSTHVDNNIHKCVECGKVFKCAAYLKKHLSHVDVIIHKCVDCGTTFKYAAGLKKHLSTHTNKSYPSSKSAMTCRGLFW